MKEVAQTYQSNTPLPQNADHFLRRQWVDCSKKERRLKYYTISQPFFASKIGEKKKGWFKRGKGSRANPQKRLLYHASGTAATQKPEQRIIKPKRETIDFAASVSYNISDPKK